MPRDSLAAIRRRFAQKIAKRQKVTDPRLIEAFAAVPREDFLGPGPWHVLNNTPHYVATASDDPALVYVNAPIALDAARRINNGEPALHIGMLASLAPQPGDHVVHIGVGGGYYTAIIARLVGPGGRVTAIEYDPVLAQRATANLASVRNIEVICADGTSYEFDPADSIYVDAGATRATPSWLDKLKPSGRLVMVLTADNRWGPDTEGAPLRRRLCGRPASPMRHHSLHQWPRRGKRGRLCGRACRRRNGGSQIPSPRRPPCR